MWCAVVVGLAVVVAWTLCARRAFAIEPTDAEMADAAEWASERLRADGSALPISFAYGGRASADILGSRDAETWDAKLEEQPRGDGGTERTVTITDPETGLQVRIEAVAFGDFPAVEWVVHVTNTGPSDTPIIEDLLPLDVLASGPDGGYPVLRYSKGGLCDIDDFEPVETGLWADSPIHIQPGGGRSSSEVLPFFSVETGSSGVVVGVGWTGEWGATFSRHDDGDARLQAGQAKTHLKLHPGESIRTPSILLLFWDGQHRRGNNLLRQFILAHHRPIPDGEPLELPILASGWGGTATKEHLELIARIDDYDVPIKTYWIDAEWYGRPPWSSSVGNWNVNAELHPDGLRPIGDALHAAGMEFLLWWEPQRVCAGTPWYEFRNREGWLLPLEDGDPQYQQIRGGWPTPHDDPRWPIWESRRTRFGYDEMLYNLGNPEALEFVTDFVSDGIAEFGLDWYREDANIAPHEFWVKADAPDRQGMTEIRYIEGLYAFWDALLERHPHLKIDNCSSGGRRIDLESVGRSTALHRTDWARDSRHAQCHSYGIFGWVPLQMAARDASLVEGGEYEVRSIMGTGLNVRLGPDKQIARAMLEQYVGIRQFFYGDYYPLSSYSQATDVWMAWQFDRPDLGSGLVQVFRREDSPHRTAQYALEGLDPDAVYVVEDLDAGSLTEVRGRGLMGEGLSVEISAQPGSALITYRRRD